MNDSILRDLRMALGLTQSELARSAGVSEQTIVRMEMGRRVLPQTVDRVMDAVERLRADGGTP